MKKDKPILVAGATGYVGGRLIPALLDAGYQVRAMGRSVEKLACRPWGHHPKVEWVKGDVLDVESLKKALSGCKAAYYLVHSMIAQKHKFVEADRLWWLRGLMDRFVGGVGLRRGRRHPTELRIGDSLDFWRVLDVSPKEQLSLLAEMKVPGEALLEFKIDSIGAHETELQMLSRFLPKGLGGIVYWYIFYPFHEWIFFGMLHGIARAIEKPIVSGPERFTPRLHDSCAFPTES